MIPLPCGGKTVVQYADPSMQQPTGATPGWQRVVIPRPLAAAANLNQWVNLWSGPYFGFFVEKGSQNLFLSASQPKISAPAVDTDGGDFVKATSGVYVRHEDAQTKLYLQWQTNTEETASQTEVILWLSRNRDTALPYTPMAAVGPTRNTGSFITPNPTVLLTPVEITPHSGQLGITLQNLGTATIYWGFTADRSTVIIGQRLLPGLSVPIPTQQSVFVSTDTAGAAPVNDCRHIHWMQ